MSLFGSSSAPTTQFSTQTNTASPAATKMYGTAWKAATSAASTPFQQYSTDPNAFVAPMNATQNQATANIAGLQGAAQPFYQMGAGMVGAAGNTSSAGLMPQYMNPYMSQVIDPVRASINQQQAMQTQGMNADQIKNGAFGQERGGLMRAVLKGQQNLGLGQALSPLYQDAYKTGLSAAQTDLQRQMQAGQIMGGLGSGYVGTGISAADALMKAGTVQQNTEQAGKTALYNQFLMQQQYPYQQAQFLATVAGGLGPGYGGTSSGYQTSQQPLSFWGNTLSDPHLKVGAEGDEPEVIGSTNDGQDIYRYRVVNPDTGELGPVQIGLMADEVQERRPDAIGDYKGFQTVDYAKATDNAARLGGGVKPEGGDYASGGGVGSFNMPSASLSMPSLSFAHPQEKKSYGLGNALMDAAHLYETGSHLKDGYDTMMSKIDANRAAGEPTRLSGAGMAEAHDVDHTDFGQIGGYAAGGGLPYGGGGKPYSVGLFEPEHTQGPSDFNMPSAHLDAPKLSFSSPSSGGGGGLSDAVDLGSKILSIGMKVAPMLPFSDRRLKTGVRPGREKGGPISRDDEDYVARTLIKEAGGEGDQGMRAVADVIRNRLRSGKYGDTAKDVVLAPKQFSPWNDEARGTRADPRTVDPSSGLYKRALGLARDELSGDNDITGGAMNFYNPKLVSPKWAKGKGGLDIGNHRFLDASGARGASAMTPAPREERPGNAGIDAIAASAPAKGLAPKDESAPAAGLTGFLRGTRAESLGEKAGDFLTSERFLVPLLTGLGTMASSNSRFLVPSILQGVGAGAKAYMEVPQVQAETAIKQAEAENKRALTPKFAAEADLVKAQTRQADAQTGNLTGDMLSGALVEKGGLTYVRVIKPDGTPGLVLYGDYNAHPDQYRIDVSQMGKTSSAPPVSAAPDAAPPAASPAPGQAAPPAEKPKAAKPTVMDDDFAALPPELVQSARESTSRIPYMPQAEREKLPNLFNDQTVLAKSAGDQKQNILPLAGALASLPKEGKISTSGRMQEFLQPLAGYLNNLAAIAGVQSRFSRPEDLSNQEEVKKIVSRMQQEAAASGHQHAFAALREMAEGIPSLLNSPGGQAKLVAQLMTTNQRQIDKDRWFSAWRKEAAGSDNKNAAFATMTSADANRSFDERYDKKYAAERNALEKIFKSEVEDFHQRDAGGKPKRVSLMTLLATHPEDVDPELISELNKTFPGVSRYFGLR